MIWWVDWDSLTSEHEALPDGGLIADGKRTLTKHCDNAWYFMGLNSSYKWILERMKRSVTLSSDDHSFCHHVVSRSKVSNIPNSMNGMC